LDEVAGGVRGARQRLAALERGERGRTGIRSLKVAHNKVFGYYLEVTTPNRPLVPPNYICKQTMANCSRYITSELKELETAILHAESRIEELERAIYQELLARLGEESTRLLTTADAVAHLDVFLALAEVAVRRNYTQPLVDDGNTISIVEGRHPAVEAALGANAFVPNDCRLAGAGCRVMLLTGPNMGGKSTYLRQVALIVLLAQIGSYVPATDAHIGVVDQIFTRVGAQDDISAGASTFMVEMAETAAILRHASARSLVVLDEVGRGTSNYDGLAIAQAIIEHLHNTTGARTLFATHYHELTTLA